MQNEEITSKIEEVFAHQGWPRDLKNQSDNDLHLKIYSLLEKLEGDQKSLVVELLKEFTYVHGMSVCGLINVAANSIDQDQFSNITGVVLLPLWIDDVEYSAIELFQIKLLKILYPEFSIKKKADHVEKSGHNMLYTAQHLISKTRPEFSNHKIRVERDVNNFCLEDRQGHNDLIIFLDDFIGTGTQAHKIIKKFERIRNNKCERFLILSAVAMRHGVEFLRDNGIQLVSGKVIHKGISESRTMIDKEKAKRLMKEIEANLKVSKSFRFGYRKSEALCAMNQRTPNNTFPIFWYGESENGWPEVFKR